MTSFQPTIQVRNLVKRYGPRTAVDDLSFDVQPGEIFALLGPNGAGKTTTVEILEGYQRADGGEVRVLGLDPATEGRELKPLIGAMPQEGGLYPAINPREALALFARYYPRHQDPADLLRLVDLEDSAGTRYRRLSGGQKQRLSLALALIGCPRLVFLDEPTAGLDPQARRRTWELIQRLREEEVTVLLTTHYLEEAEQLADHVAIINNGSLVAQGTPASLTAGDRSRVRLRTATPVAEELIASLPGLSGLERDGANTLVIETAAPQAFLAAVTARLLEADVPILELRVGQSSLEEVYLDLTEAAV